MIEGQPVRRGLVDIDRRDGVKRSLSIDTIGDLKFFWGTTGVIAAGDGFDLYLTSDGEVGGEGMFTKIPPVVVYADASAETGGFPRGPGPLGPDYSYSGEPHIDFLVDWHKNNHRWYVRVTNTTGVDRDFAVCTQGV